MLSITLRIGSECLVSDKAIMYYYKKWRASICSDVILWRANLAFDMDGVCKLFML